MREPIVNIAVSAARSAGNTILKAADRMDRVKVSEKGQNDYVTEIDKLVEKEIVATIKKAYPDHSIVGEEGGDQKGKNADAVWIIDPIDGTRNFIHGFPHYAISIAFEFKGKIEHGVIYDPVRQEMFSASRGKGARMNDNRIRVSARKKLEDSLLATGFPARRSEEFIDASTEVIKSLLPICGDIRRPGAATLDLAYVACGRLDGFWERDLHIWDIAAGALLVKEAGGLVSDFDGSENFLETGNIVASNPKILKYLMKVLNSQKLD